MWMEGFKGRQVNMIFPDHIRGGRDVHALHTGHQELENSFMYNYVHTMLEERMIVQGYIFYWS